MNLGHMRNNTFYECNYQIMYANKKKRYELWYPQVRCALFASNALRPCGARLCSRCCHVASTGKLFLLDSDACHGMKLKEITKNCTPTVLCFCVCFGLLKCSETTVCDILVIS